MLSLELEDFMVQLKDGTINNIGGPTKRAAVKLFDVERAEARPFGDNRVKIVCEDAEGNDVQIALFPEEVDSLEADLATIRDSGSVDGLEPGGE